MAETPTAMNLKTPLSQFIIDEESSAFDMPNIGNNKRLPQQYRERPRHSSQTDFTEFLKKREEEEKENHFDAQINLILNSFAKQYMREYIKMKIKASVFDTIDKELNRKSFTSIPQYYHLKKKDLKSPRHPNQVDNMSKELQQTEGFQPVYSLRYIIITSISIIFIHCDYALYFFALIAIKSLKKHKKYIYNI